MKKDKISGQNFERISPKRGNPLEQVTILRRGHLQHGDGVAWEKGVGRNCSCYLVTPWLGLQIEITSCVPMRDCTTLETQ